MNMMFGIRQPHKICVEQHQDLHLHICTSVIKVTKLFWHSELNSSCSSLGDFQLAWMRTPICEDHIAQMLPKALFQKHVSTSSTTLMEIS